MGDEWLLPELCRYQVEDAQSILVIIVSSILTLFLIVLIVLMVLVIKLVKQLRLIADKAEKAVASVESAGQILKNTSGPLALFKVARNLIKHFKD